VRRFDQLTDDEKNKAISNRLESITKGLVSGEFKLMDEDNGNNAQQIVDSLVAAAKEKRDMRLAVGWILQAEFTDGGKTKSMQKEITELAEAEAWQCFYAGPDDKVIVLHERP
jgi:hypothetical protein